MKKITSFFILFLLGMFGFANYVFAQSNPTKLVIHYYRYDNNYDNFNVWLWDNLPNDTGGIKFDFNNADVDEKGAYLEVKLEGNFEDTSRFGIIIKQGEWQGYREVGGDRFFNLADMEVKGGKVHAYFVQQDINIGLSDNDLSNNIPDYRDKILTAAFNKNNKVVVNASKDVVSYTVYENNKNIATGNNVGSNFTVDINNLDITKDYQVEVFFDHAKEERSIKDVSIHNLYDSQAFEDSYTYHGELGAIYEKSKTTFRLWAPLSDKVVLNLYNQGHPMYNRNGQKSIEDMPYETHEMTAIEKGAWEFVVNEDMANHYYTFSVTNNDVTHEVTDPYSHSTGANGMRSMIVDFAKTNPEEWEYDSRPETITNLTDYIVYELHVRDLTSHSSWNGSEENRGTFMGFTEEGTTYSKNGKVVTTGLDHIVELGVNAVQLLPIFDYGYIDEVKMATDENYNNTFNWGYMPYHLNGLEGSLSTNPFDGEVRVKEFKQLVNTLHNKDIRVIMDVVYNHTGESEGSNFDKIIPGYYHRLNADGGFSNGSGTGNETASERSMVREFMLDSLKFWATEYNLSGFRFDLMKLHDVETMQQIEDMLYDIDPTIVLYGEPWDAGGSALDQKDSAGKENLHKFDNTGAFNDNMRDAIKGPVMGRNDGGWLQGKDQHKHVENIKYGIVGGVNHQQVHIDKWHLSPQKTINYVSAHDNNTLHDILRISNIRGPKLEAMQVQANAIVLTSQGIPFIHAGAEMMRSKPAVDGGYDHNSYESPDAVNQLRWDRKLNYNNVFEYYKTLIQIRKTYPQLRLINSDDITQYLNFLDTGGNNTIAFEINVPNMASMVVIHSSNDVGTVNINNGKEYKLLTSGEDYNLAGIATLSNTLISTPNTTSIYVEVTTPSKVTVKENTISLDKGESFDPLSNISVTGGYSRIYSNSFYNTNVSGNYIISVSVVDNFGNVSIVNYMLNIKGNKYKVDFKGDVIV